MNDRPKRHLFGRAVGGVAAFALAAWLGALVAGPGRVADAADSETYRQLSLFGEVFERVRDNYVDIVDDQALIEAALNGMLQSLDPHSSYLPPKQFDEMQVRTRGSFGGLGIEVTMENGLVKVVAPIDDTPAFRAGLQAGDFITHIDDEAVLGLTLPDAIKRMRGKPKTEVLLRVSRSTVEPFEVTIVREVIRIQSVRARAEENVGYVRISSFTEQTRNGLQDAMEKLRNEIGPEMEGIIIDLRNNPGGLLEQAVAVADAFLDRGSIVSTRGRQANSQQQFNATGGDLANGLPIVVLINGGSASASEIVAGALQDHERAILMGTQTFGKGSVQTIIPVSADGAMRLTTALYYTPSGRSIQSTGITPDIEVPRARVELLGESSTRRESTLRGHIEQQDLLPNEASPNPPPAGGGQERSPEAAPPPGDGVTAAAPTGPETEDYQLQRALDLIRGLTVFSMRPA